MKKANGKRGKRCIKNITRARKKERLINGDERVKEEERSQKLKKCKGEGKGEKMRERGGYSV